jgi:hypothetical protein
MKVKIGPYKNWFGPYQLAEKILFWKDPNDPIVCKLGELLAYGKLKANDEHVRIFNLERNETLLCKFLTWVHSIRYERKIKVKIDKWDTWSMYHTLAYIILPMLKQLKETKHGAPHVDDEDVPEHLRSTSAAPRENEYDVDSNHFARWDWVLDEMIFAFDCQVGDNKEWEDQFYTGVSDYNLVKVEGTNYSRFEHGPNHTRKWDKEGFTKFHSRIQNGYRLFGKYYENLWD